MGFGIEPEGGCLYFNARRLVREISQVQGIGVNCPCGLVPLDIFRG